MISFALLWIVMLAGSLLAVGFVTAAAARCRKPRWQKFWPILFSFLTCSALALICFFLGVLIFQDLSLDDSSRGGIQPQWVFWYWLALAVCFFLGSLAVMRAGLKRSFDNDPPARFWPARKIAAGLVAAMLAFPSLVWFMAEQLAADMSKTHKEATDKLVGMVRTCPPGAENARPAYDKAFESLNSDKARPAWFSDTRDDVTKEDLQALLSKHRETLSLAYAAAALPCWESEVDLTKDSYEWPIPNFLNYRNLAYLLFHSARAKALSGDTAGALQELAAIEKQVAHLRKDPVPVTLMISIALDQTRIRGLEYVLVNNKKNMKGDIALPVKAYKPEVDRFLRMLTGQTLSSLQVFSGIGARGVGFFGSLSGGGTASWPARFVDLTKIPFIFLFPADIKATQSLYRLMDRPVRSYDGYIALLDEYRKTVQSEGGLFTLISYPAQTPYLARCMAFDARRGLADLALAATAYKEAQGKYPEKLEDLVPAYIDRVPTDPFDGKPLKMKAVSGGLDLYSASVNPARAELKSDPIHFYLGREAYGELRVKPETEARLKREQQLKEKKQAKPAPDAKK